MGLRDDNYKLNGEVELDEGFSHLTSMLFCHFAKSESLRDISNGLGSATGNLNHLGNVHAPNEVKLRLSKPDRNWQLFRDYYYALQKQLGQDLY